MTSLFSSFDLFFFFKSVLIVFLGFVFFSLKSFYFEKISLLLNFITIDFLSKFFQSLKSKSFNKLSSLMLISIMFFIVFFNVLSVFPFNFALTSQFGLVLGMGLVVWFSFTMFTLILNFTGFICHFIPSGSPVALVPFLFLVEMVSSGIRPLTLAVRLVANILAGHLLMILLAKMAFLSSSFFFLYMVLNLVEIFVGIIQSYIFVTMIALYYSEVH